MKKLFFDSYKIPLLLFALFVWVPHDAEPEETGVSISDEKESWSVGISRFTGVGLSSENSYLTFTLPTLVLEKLRICDTHHFSDDEKQGYRQLLIRDKKEDLMTELSGLYEKEDALLFSAGDNRETREKYQQEIIGIREKISSLDNYPAESIDIADEKQVEILGEESADPILDVFRFSSRYMMKKNSLDFYIWGSVEEIEDYFFIQVFVRNGALPEDEILVSDAASKTDIDAVVARMNESIMTAVIGRPWSLLTVDADPENSYIYMDEEFLGSGSISSLIIEPGDHVLRISAPGRTTVAEEFTAEPFVNNMLTYVLKEKSGKSLTVTSLPPGANVYDGAFWLGTTPLTLLRSENYRRLLVTYDQYQNRSITLPPGNEDDIHVSLSPFKLDRGAYIEKKQNAFYRAAGFLVLSFPLPFIFYSMSEDLANGALQAIEAGNTDSALLYADRSEAAYYSYVGTMVVAVSLLINTVFHLAEYIMAAEYHQN